MIWAELRGTIAVAIILGTIAVTWTLIESREVEVRDPSIMTISTTTTSRQATTTIDQDARNTRICELARNLDSETNLVLDQPPGTVARVMLDFWRAVEPLAGSGARAEIGAVVSYYEDYLETAGPFDFNTGRIILEGDKEKLQQLLTRPAPGLEESRALVGFGCGVDLPQKPSMSLTSFDELEDRLLDPDNDE